MLAVHDGGEVTSATSAVDLERPLAGPLPAADLRLDHAVDLAQTTEAVDLRRAARSSTSPPLSLPFPPDAAADATRGRTRAPCGRRSCSGGARRLPYLFPILCTHASLLHETLALLGFLR